MSKNENKKTIEINDSQEDILREDADILNRQTKYYMNILEQYERHKTETVTEVKMFKEKRVG